MSKTLKTIIIAAVIVIILSIAIFLIVDYRTYHPDKIIEGENKFKLENYNIEENGLLGLKKIFDISENLSERYDVSSLEAEVSKSGKVKSFTIALNNFSDNDEYMGTAVFSYSGYTHILSYSKATDFSSNMLVFTKNKNSSLDYLDEQFKKIPLREQIKKSGLSHYFLWYQPFTQIEDGAPIFDGREGTKFSVLSQDEYNSGDGGTSDGKTNVVVRLYDGQSIASGQQYLYVFKPINQEAAIGNQLSEMQCDYYISNGVLKFTKNYGESWIASDITPDELNETMDFYQNNLSLPAESIFISSDETVPVAFFYSGNPMLKILKPNTDIWVTTEFKKAADFGRAITKWAVGFVNSSFGYAALGTDWSMGGGETKMCYFTSDGGDSWEEKSLPMQNTSRTLLDMFMADEKTGVVALDGGMDAYFPVIIVTDDTGDNWAQAEICYNELPDDVQYLTSIEKLEYKDDKYYLTLGQSDNGVVKATFVSDSLNDSWHFYETYKETIHTVG